MKKSFKAILAVVAVMAMLLSMMPTAVFAATESKAYIMFMNGDATNDYEYWGAADTAKGGVVATDATVTGPGQYTVALDFSQTGLGQVDACQFTALGIVDGETNFPGYFYEIDSIKLNGEDIDFTKGYTSSDNGVETRVNVYNGWVGAIPEDAHVLDGDLSNVSPTIIDPALFSGVKTYEITFTVYDADGNGPEVAAAEDTATTDDAAPATDVPKTGVIGLGIVYGLGALATGAAALKRKQK
jgi:hypothetical protein